MECHNCGFRFSAFTASRYKFCPECGTPVDSTHLAYVEVFQRAAPNGTNNSFMTIPSDATKNIVKTFNSKKFSIHVEKEGVMLKPVKPEPIPA